jgi:small subunit ribosomal protein S5
MLKATVNGLQRLRRPEEVAQIRGLTVSQVLPIPKHVEKPAAEEAPAVEAAAVEEPVPEEEATDGEVADNSDA